MKYRLLFFILILLLSITSVSAEMDNSTVENYTTGTDDANLLTASDESDTLEATPQCYYNLFNTIGGYINTNPTINLNTDYRYGISNDDTRYWYYSSIEGRYIHFYEGIMLSRAMTINGNGHSIDGNNTARIFFITGSNVVLKNIVFKNALYDYGAGIYWKGGSGTIENCTFINCLSWDGAAIFSLDSSLTLKQCTFTDNQAIYSGGALYGMYGTYSLDNCKFIKNIATDGGAICVDAYKSLKISNSEFTSNTASRYGGAVATRFNSTTTTTNNKFTGNKAQTGNDFYNIPLSVILDTSAEVDTLITYNPDTVTTLPAYYDLRQEGYLTPVKNQGSDGNCWSFAAMAALESAILKATGTLYDFSENNMKNLAAIYSDYGRNIATNTGGTSWMSISYLTSWLGPVNESADPYYDDGNLYSDLLLPLLHIQDVVLINRNSYTDLNPIKKAIMQYGAVAISLYSSDDYIYGSSWYCPDDNTGTNHAITLVGWNDTYSRYNFKTTAPGDGAWIMRNSWGENSGDGGYYYVSYYDKSLSTSNIFTFSFENDINYDYIYQHEFERTTNFWWEAEADNINPDDMVYKTIWFKNIYTAASDEFIAGTSTWFDYDLNYEVTVEVTHDGKTSTYTQAGRSAAGYHTIKLDKFIPVETGDVFSITFKFESPIYWFAASKDSLRTFSRPGISYSSWNGNTWRDLSDYKSIACIKGFTLDTIDSELNILDIGEVKVSDDFNIIVNVTDQFKTPVNKGTVTFIINSTEYSVNTTDGIADLKLNLNKSGTYNLTCIFTSDNYYSSYKSVLFEVKKHEPDMVIDVSDIDYRQNLNVNVTLNSQAAGKVLIKINELEENITLSDGKASKTFTGLNGGTYSITAVYWGDEYYSSCEKTSSFKVNRISPGLSISDVGNTVYGQDVTVRYNIATDTAVYVNVNIYKDEILIKSESTQDKTLNFNNLDAGLYRVNIRYEGNSNYNAEDKTTTFTVAKSASSITANLQGSINYSETLTINPVLTNGSEFNYALVYNSNTIKTATSTGNIVLSNLNAGSYTITITNKGDKNHNSSNITLNFEVKKINAELALKPVKSITYGEDIYAEYTLKNGLAGNVKISLYSKGQFIESQTVNNLKATFKNLESGDYTLTAEYLDSTNYYNTIQQSQFSIIKADSQIKVTSPDTIKYGEDYTSDIELINASSADYILYLNGNQINKGSTSDYIEFKKLNAGNYTLIVNIAESKNYKSSSYTRNFKVEKTEAEMNINILNSIYGNDIIIPLNITGTGHANILIYKNGLNVNKTFDINDREAKFSLDAGKYSVTIIYSGDGNHNPNSLNSNFEVYKASSRIELTSIGNITYADELKLNAELINGSEGSYKLYKNTALIKNTNLNDMAFTDLSAGNYTIALYNNGDENHNPSNITYNFTVHKKTISLTIGTIENVTYNNPIIITYNLPDVKINIYNNQTNITKEVKETHTTFENLNAGNYTLFIEYEGNENYTKTNATTKFTVFKAQTTLNINPISTIYYGNTVNINYDLTTTDNVTIIICKNNTLIRTENTENKTLNFDKLDAGEYSITIRYDGDDNHIASQDNSTFRIEKSASSITVDTIKSINYGETITITPKLTNGSKITYTLTYSTTKSAEEIIILDNLNAGNYTITITNNGDKNHNPSSITQNFEVKKIDSELTITDIQNITYGENLNIKYTLKKGLSGHVKISIYSNGKLIENQTVNNTKATFQNLNAGNYTVTAEYLDNTNYYNTIQQSQFSILKADSQIKTESLDSIRYGNDYTVQIELINASSGNYKLYLNNTLINESSISSLLKFNKLSAGNYTLKLNSDESDNYKSNNYTLNFKVIKADSAVTIHNLENITYGEDLIINTILNNGTTGSYEIYKENGLITNNTLNHNKITDLSAGNYRITIYNNGDENHNPSNITYNFTVNKKTPKLTIDTIENVTYNDSVKITYALPNVKINIFNNQTNITKEVKENYTTFENLNAGNYTLFIEYQGNENYTKANATSKFSVFKASSTVSITPISTISYGNTVNVNYDLTAGVTGYVTICIFKNNILIRSNTTKDKLVSFDNLDAGEYFVNIRYSGDNNYIASEINSTFKIEKSASSITADTVNNINYSETLTINPTLTNGSEITYTLKYNSNTIKTESAKDIIVLDNLNAGNYTITITNKGDENHNSSNITLNFKVKQIDPELTITDICNITYGENLTVEYTLKKDTKGEVKISIYSNGKLIENQTVNNSKAAFKNLNAGNYTVTAEYLDTTNYYSTIQESQFSIIKADSQIIIVSPDEIYYNNTYIADIQFINGIHGRYELYLDEKPIAENNISEKLIFNNLNAGNYTIIIFNDGDLNHNSSTISKTFTVLKAKSSVVINPIGNISYGDKADIKVTYINGSGNWQLILNGSTVDDMTCLEPGLYTVKAYNAGDENHSESEAYCNFSVLKAYPKISINDINPVVYGDNIIISYNCSADVFCEFKVENTSFVYTTTTNEQSFTLPVLDAGNYTLNASTIEDTHYNSVSISKSFQIIKASSLIKIDSILDITYGDVENVSVKFMNLSSGYYILSLKGKEIVKANLTETISFNNLSWGEYELTVINKGDKNHNESKDTGFFTVNKKSPEIIIKPIEDTYFMQTVNITYYSPDDLKGPLTVCVFNSNNESVLNKTFDSSENITLNTLKTGEYIVNITYPGNDNYLPAYSQSQFKVKSKISADITVSTYKTYTINKTEDCESLNYIIQSENSAVNISIIYTDNLEIIINSEKYANVNNLNLYSYDLEGNITVKVRIYGKEYNETVNSVVKTNCPVNITKTNNQLMINMSDDAKGKAIFNINNKTYEKELVNGIAILDTSSFENGVYSYTVTYTGDGKYSPFTESGYLTISKSESKIIITQNKKILYIKLTGNDSQAISDEIQININGNIRYLKTGANGEVSISLGNLKPRSYSVRVTFNGNENYLKSESASRIKIVKEKPKVIAKKKTFKLQDKNKKYKVTLKGIKKVKITMKIKGKTYRAKTNNKGVAVFKLKKLQIKGTFKAKIIFKGSTYYKSIKKTVKIKIK